MCKSEQRDLFLVLAVFGLLASFAVIFSAVTLMIGTTGDLIEEIKTSNTAAFIERTRTLWPASLVGSTVLLGTILSYRRYQKLTDRQDAS